MAEELKNLKAPGEDSEQIADVFTGMEIPALIGPLERAGRLAADQELTLKILELRLAKSESRDGRWPASLPLSDSGVCPGSFYEYRTDGRSMTIAFMGAPPVPPAGLQLPLSFSARRRGPAPDAHAGRATPALRKTGVTAGGCSTDVSIRRNGRGLALRRWSGVFVLSERLIPIPAYVASLAPRDAADARRLVSLVPGRATAIEMRLDRAEDRMNARDLIALDPRPLIVTYRTRAEGGDFPGSAAEYRRARPGGL